MMRKSPNEYQLVFPDYPEMKIGFSTQNFMKCIPFTAESMNELLLYASEEGYQFIELRDNEAQLSVEACKALELVAVEDREECFKNHSRSISYLKDLGIVVR